MFHDFYTELYTENDTGGLSLTDMGLPATLWGQLAQTDVEPIRMGELEQAINSLAVGKAAGPDRLPLEVFKIFFQEIKNDMLKVYQTSQKGEIPRTWSEANICVLKKKWKPSELPGSYHPISLLNADGKIYAKILATRLAKIIPSIVLLKQHSFIPGRGTVDHVRRVITLQDIVQVESRELGLILLNAEKALDRVLWHFLSWGLQHMGFRQGYIRALNALYHLPSVKICSMGYYSETIAISRGTRQGCPCSPLLSALYINPFILRLEQSRKILPCKVQQEQYSVMVYANDIAIVTCNPCLAIPEIESLAQTFGALSGYKLNTAKTQILCTSQAMDGDARCVKEAIYLGIKIRTSVKEIVEVNWGDIIWGVKCSLER